MHDSFHFVRVRRRSLLCFAKIVISTTKHVTFNHKGATLPLPSRLTLRNEKEKRKNEPYTMRKIKV